MAGPSAEGVVDHRNRVFGEGYVYIWDGSALAVTKRAMSFNPRGGETDWNDEPGA